MCNFSAEIINTKKGKYENKYLQKMFEETLSEEEKEVRAVAR